MMTTELPKYLASALSESGDDGLEVVDPDTQRVYHIVDDATYRRAKLALLAQQQRDAISQGLAQMEAGEGKPAEQAFDEISQRLGFPT